MLTGAFPSRSGRSLYDWKNKLGGEESAYGTAARIAALPARTRPTTTARRSLTSGPRQSARASGRPLFAPIKSPRSIDPESPAEPREGDNPFRSAPNPSQRLPDKPGARLRHVSALPVRRVRFGPSQLPRQNASLTFGVCHSRCFCRPCPSPARAALSFRVRVWAFSAMRG